MKKDISSFRTKRLFSAGSITMAVMAMIIVVFSGCEKYEQLRKYGNGGTGNGKTNYFVRLTDAPGQFTEVNVDIRSVIVKTNRGEVTLNISPGIYNLLDFRNGRDTLIATGALDSATVSQIRLVLGTNNSVVVDSVSYPLDVPSGEQSGLKLQVHHELKAGVAYGVLLDFDANKSVVKTGNGKYKLKPVIRTIDSAISGSIKGKISPDSVSCVIVATFGGNSYTTTPDPDGTFLLRGLPPGIYDLTVTPVSPYTAVTVTGIIVTKGISTHIGTLNL